MPSTAHQSPRQDTASDTSTSQDVDPTRRGVQYTSNDELYEVVESEFYTGSVKVSEMKAAEARVGAMRQSLVEATPTLDAFAASVEAAGVSVEAYDPDGLGVAMNGLSETAGALDAALAFPDGWGTLDLVASEERDADLLVDRSAACASYDLALDGLDTYVPAYDTDIPAADAPPGISKVMAHTLVAAPWVATAAAVRDVAPETALDGPGGCEGIRSVVGLFQMAGPEARAYLLDGFVEAQPDPVAVTSQIAALAQADVLAALHEEDAGRAESQQEFQIDRPGSGFHEQLGAIIEAAAGRMYTEAELSGRVDIPLVGGVRVHGALKLVVANLGEEGFKANVDLFGGLSVSGGGDTSLALRAGLQFEAVGASGVNTARMLQLGLEAAVRASQEEGPPALGVAATSWLLISYCPVGWTIEGSRMVWGWISEGRTRSLVWDGLANAAFKYGDYHEIIGTMLEGEYVEIFDGVGALAKGENEEGAGAKGELAGGLVRRLAKGDAGVEESVYHAVKFGVEVGADDVAAKVEGTLPLQVHEGTAKGEIKGGMSFTVDAGPQAGIAQGVFLGAVGNTIGKLLTVVGDEDTEAVRNITHLKQLQEEVWGVVNDAVAGALSMAPGARYGVDVELGLDLSTGVWTVGVFLVQKAGGSANVAGGEYQRKQRILKRSFGNS